NSAINDACSTCGMPLRAPVAAAEPPTTTSVSGPKSAGTQPTLSSPPSTPSSADSETPQFTTAFYSTRVARDAPLAVSLNFTTMLVSGLPSIVQLQIKNLSSSPLEVVEILLESRGLKHAVIQQISQLPPDQSLRLPLNVEPAGAGNFVLQCSAKLKTGGQLMGF